MADQLVPSGIPSRSPLASVLGQVLNYPVSDLPTQEDFEAWLLDQLRQDPKALIQPIGPTEAREVRQARAAADTGQDVLDWLAQALSVAGILRGSAAGRQQELMSKTRARETFGKDVLETSRRAQPQRWRAMEQENWHRERNLPGMEGRTYDPNRHGMPPEAPMPRRAETEAAWQAGELRPPDRVMRGGTSYYIGDPTILPGNAAAQYHVWSDSAGQFRITLNYLSAGEDMARRFDVGTFNTIGEATAKARQLANRLDLAAKDMAAKRWGSAGIQEEREIRLPWENPMQTPRRWHEEGLTRIIEPGWWREGLGRPGE